LISIIIVTYNGEEFVRGLLKSLTNHSLREYFEIILVDNSSFDGSTTVHKDFDFLNIKQMRNKSNIGYGRACNRGANAARGKFLFFGGISFPPFHRREDANAEAIL